MLNELPASDPRAEPFLQISIPKLAWGPQAAEQFAAMTPKERTVARGVIEQMTMPDERRVAVAGGAQGK